MHQKMEWLFDPIIIFCISTGRSVTSTTCNFPANPSGGRDGGRPSLATISFNPTINFPMHTSRHRRPALESSSWPDKWKILLEKLISIKLRNRHSWAVLNSVKFEVAGVWNIFTIYCQRHWFVQIIRGWFRAVEAACSIKLNIWGWRFMVMVMIFCLMLLLVAMMEVYCWWCWYLCMVMLLMLCNV